MRTVSGELPVTNIVRGFDDLFQTLRIPEDYFQNPSARVSSPEKVCGLTNTYLRPVRIGRKIFFDPVELYYGRRIGLFLHPFEVIPFDAAADVIRFVNDRILENTTDYFSIHLGNQRLNVDLIDGRVINLEKGGFDDYFCHVTLNETLSDRDLLQILKDIRSLAATATNG